MAERTEQPTPRRRQEFRQKGQVARSGEVASAASLLAGLIALRAFGPWMFEGIRDLSIRILSHPFQGDLPPNQAALSLTSAALSAGKVLLPIAALSCIGAAVANLAQTGFIYSVKPLVPDFSRINPIRGVQRLFSLRGLSELVKSLLKFVLLATVSYLYLRKHFTDLIGLSSASGLAAAGVVGNVIWGLLIRLAMVMLLVAAVDFLFQRRIFERSIRMTKEEVKEDHRRSEGDPQVKSRIRRLQQQAASRRMMQDVKEATVVVTNPIHLAVALRYEPSEHAAPVLVAKGQLKVAERIVEDARFHRVPVVENIPLARALFEKVDIGQIIPAELYQAVAEIIAFVYRLTNRTRETNRG